MAEERTVESSKNGAGLCQQEKVIPLKIDNPTGNGAISGDTEQPPGGKAWEQCDSAGMEVGGNLWAGWMNSVTLPKATDRSAEAFVVIGWSRDTRIALGVLCGPALPREMRLLPQRRDHLPQSLPSASKKQT